MRVVLHIDRLVLRGFAPGERDRIVADLQAELGRLLGDPAAAGSLAALPDAAALRIAPHPPAPVQTLVGSGVAAARSIARALVR